MEWIVVVMYEMDGDWSLGAPYSVGSSKSDAMQAIEEEIEAFKNGEDPIRVDMDVMSGTKDDPTEIDVDVYFSSQKFLKVKATKI